MNDHQFTGLMVDEAALHQLMREHMAWVSKCLADCQHQSWPPSLAALVKESPEDKDAIWLHALMIDFNEHEDKHRAMHKIGREIYQSKKIPVAVVLSSECWLSKQRPGTKAPHCEPRHDPAREEGIQVSGLTIDRKNGCIAFAPVRRYRKSNNMRAGAFSEIQKAEKVNLLDRFFFGFFEVCAEKAGVDLPECP